MTKNLDDKAYIQQVADKVESVIALAAFLIEDLQVLNAVDKQAGEISGRVATLAPIIGAVGGDYEQKQMEADVRRKRALALRAFVQTLKDTEDERTAFYEAENDKAAAREMLGRSLGGL